MEGPLQRRDERRTSTNRTRTQNSPSWTQNANKSQRVLRVLSCSSDLSTACATCCPTSCPRSAMLLRSSSTLPPSSCSISYVSASRSRTTTLSFRCVCRSRIGRRGKVVSDPAKRRKCFAARRILLFVTHGLLIVMTLARLGLFGFELEELVLELAPSRLARCPALGQLSFELVLLFVSLLLTLTMSSETRGF